MPDAPSNLRADLKPRFLIVTTVASIVAVAPPFLAGGLAVQMRGSTGLGEAAFGLALSGYFAVGAVLSVPAGRVVERIGPSTSLRLSLTVAAGGLAGIAFHADDFATLIAWMALGGVSNAVIQVASNLMVARALPPTRRGLAYGLKAGAVPAATLIAGLAVPAVALTIGWRWAYGIASAAALIVAATVPDLPGSIRTTSSGRRHLRSGDLPLSTMVRLSSATALGFCAIGSFATFLVSSGTHFGLSPAAAGLLFAGGSSLGIVTRAAMGHLVDSLKREVHVPVVAAMLALGTVAYALIATGRTEMFVFGTLLAFVAGWGWPGVFIHAVVTLNPNAPGAATGITQTGALVGMVVAPTMFGLLAEGISYVAAWTAVTVCGAGAALLMWRVGIRLGKDTQGGSNYPAPSPGGGSSRP